MARRFAVPLALPCLWRLVIEAVPAIVQGQDLWTAHCDMQVMDLRSHRDIRIHIVSESGLRSLECVECHAMCAQKRFPWSPTMNIYDASSVLNRMHQQRYNKGTQASCTGQRFVPTSSLGGWAAPMRRLRVLAWLTWGRNGAQTGPLARLCPDSWAPTSAAGGSRLAGAPFWPCRLRKLYWI